MLIGLVVLGVGGILLVTGRRTQAKTNLLRLVPTSSAADVPGLLPGEMAEVKGVIRCDAPLTSPHAGRACVWYSATVSREYEEREKDSKGEWSTNRGSETVSSSEESTPFFVEDSTGRVRVDPEGAEIDAPTTVDQFEERDEGTPFDFLTGGAGRRTLGYRTVERALVVDSPIYVLGAARESGEIGAPPPGSRERRFFLSHRSEEALSAAWGKSARWQAYGGLIAGAIGIVLLLIGVIEALA